MRTDSFNDLFIDLLSILADCENQIIEALPGLALAAEDPDLKEAFRHHLKETKVQRTRLQEIFTQLKTKPSTATCKAIQGLLKDGGDVAKTTTRSPVKDAALITAAQGVEHFEMAMYGTACAFANELGLDNVESLLRESLEEEGDANNTLTKLAEGGIFTRGINQEAKTEAPTKRKTR